MTHRRRLLATYGGYEGPLDIVPGAVVAYGQRALSAAKLGTALYTIRETAGDTTQSFSSDAVTGDAPVADIITFLNGSNGFVRTWVDQGVSASNLQNTTDAQQPKWLASVSNSKPGFGNNEAALGEARLFFQDEITFASAGCTIFWVGISTEEVPTISISNAANSEYVSFQAWSVDPRIDRYVDPNQAGGKYSDTLGAGAHIIDAAWEYGSKNLRVDGVTKTLSIDYDSGGALSGFTGDANEYSYALISESGTGNRALEIIVYDGVLTDQQRSDIRTNIATYYGITL